MKQEDFFIAIQESADYKGESLLIKMVSQSLKISESGAYKKVKGITKLTLAEASRLAEHCGVQLDIRQRSSNTANHPFTFYCDDLVTPPSSYEQWASNILNHSRLLDKLRSDYKVWSYQSQLSYFHIQPFRHLLYLKLYAWNRSSWDIPTREKFSISDFTRNYALNSVLDKVIEHHVSYDETAIWQIDMLNGIFSQIKYFHQLGIFDHKEDLQMVIRDLYKLIDHLEAIAQSGRKQIFGKKGAHGKLEVYLNYTQSSPNIIYIKAPQFRMVYNQYLIPNYVRTSNDDICDYADKWISKIINQSVLISSSGEVARSGFFSQLRHDLQLLVNTVT